MRILEGEVLPGDDVLVDRDGKKDVMKFERAAGERPAAAAVV